MFDAWKMDFVICVEATKAMTDIADEVKLVIKKIINDIPESCEDIGIRVAKLRVKFILFRDYGCCPEAMIESDFMDIIDETEKVFNYIDNIEFKGGYGYCNALEAVALALKSNWTTGHNKVRRAVMMFSRSSVHPLGLKSRTSSYPADMPADVPQLITWLHGNEQITTGIFLPRTSVFVAFVPDIEPWRSLQASNIYYMHYVSYAGVGVEDIDIRSATDLMVNNDL